MPRGGHDEPACTRTEDGGAVTASGQTKACEAQFARARQLKISRLSTRVARVSMAFASPESALELTDVIHRFVTLAHSKAPSHFPRGCHEEWSCDNCCKLHNALRWNAVMLLHGCQVAACMTRSTRTSHASHLRSSSRVPSTHPSLRFSITGHDLRTMKRGKASAITCPRR